MARTMNPEAKGDARTAILDAAMELVGRDGAASLSMRELARRAGVSHQTPNHHFKTRDGLLSELAVRGFVELDRVIGDALAGAGDDGRDQLVAAGAAYVQFALRRRGLFRLMWQHAELTPDARARMNEAYSASWRKLEGAVARLNGLPEGDPDASAEATAVSAAIHGLATFLADEVMRPADPAATARQVLGRVADLVASFAQRSAPRGERPARRR